MSTNNGNNQIIDWMNHSFLEFLNNNRKCLMGLAIIFVIVCHFVVVVDYDILRPLVFFGGVDIFMFLSGVGIVYSYNNNNLKVFEKKRIIRLYPAFFIFAVLTTLLRAIESNEFIVSDLFYNITTLSYYGLGTKQVDWYLSTFIPLSIISPLFIELIKKYGEKFVILSYLLSYIVVYFIQDPAYNYYSAFVVRLPLYLLGISLSLNKKITHWYLFLFMFMIGIVESKFLGLLFLLKASICVPGLYVLRYIIERTPKVIISKLDWLSKYTLELYISNMLCILLCHFASNHAAKIVIYFGALIILAVIVYFINSTIAKYLKRFL